MSRKIIDQDDFSDEMRRRAIKNAMNCTQQSFPCLVVKYYYHACVRQLVCVFQLPTPVKNMGIIQKSGNNQHAHNNSVFTVAGICNSVGDGFFCMQLRCRCLRQIWGP